MKQLHLTSAELAVRWAMHPGTLANWRSDGTGPSFLRVSNGRVLYRLADIESHESHGYVMAVA